MARGMADKAGARAKDRIASFGSIDCTEESLAQAFNRWRECGAGYYAGKPRSEWAQGGLDAVIRGVRLEKERDPPLHNNPAGPWFTTPPARIGGGGLGEADSGGTGGWPWRGGVIVD